MSVTYQQVTELAEQLSKVDKARLVEHLSGLLRQEIEQDDAKYRRMWHDHLERMAGSLADDPIERPPQLEFEERDEIV